MFCHNCGTKLDEGSAFCPECGARQDPEDEPQKKGKKGLVIVLILVVVIAVAVGVGGFFVYRNLSSSKTETKSSEEKDSAKKEKTQKKSEDTEDEGSKDKSVKDKDKEDEDVKAEDSKKKDAGESLEGKAPKKEEKKVAAPVYEYQVIAQRMTWSEAKSYCESQGGRLATPGTKEEYDKVIQKANESGLKVLWLGGQRTSDGSGFEWLSGETFSFGSWASGEPNNDQGVENRLGMMYVNGAWKMYDMPDDISAYYSANIVGFVMEKEVTQ